MVVAGFCDRYPNKLKNSEIDVSLNWLEKRLGKLIATDDIAERLQGLGFEVSFNGDNMRVIAPTWRSTGDITIPEDIIEEIARMYGFENFEATPISTTFVGAINQLEIDLDRNIREYLAFRCGMREIFTYPWMYDAYANALFPNKEDMLSLSAPPSPDEHYIRTSLLPNICKAVEGNLRFFDEFSLFESAQVFFNKDFKTPYDSRESLPLQQKNIAGVFVGNFESVSTLFRKAKGVLEAFPRYVHIEPLLFGKVEKPVWADDVLWLNIFSNNQRAGNLALLSKKASLDCGIKNSAVMIFELILDMLNPYPSRTNRYSHLPEYPETDYDISLFFDSSVKWDDIYKVITCADAPEELLQSASLLDEYKGRQVPEGKKSITFRLVIGSLVKTLTSEEIERCANAIVKRLKKNLGAELRV
jgi:phenylalanyl-tRNA synthetase beta chain